MQRISSPTKLLTPPEDKEKKAILIQKIYRGYRDRKQYQITHLAHDQKTHYPAFLVGNDPKIVLQEKNKGNIALIGTSGFRSILLACQLGDKDNQKITPKIFLVDNSIKVQQLWIHFKKFTVSQSTADEFLKNLPLFLIKNQEVFKSHPESCIAFFTRIFQKFQYDYVHRIIIHTSFISQSWSNLSTFTKLKNILDRLNIKNVYAYPSNIAACMDDEQSIDDLLLNIQLLNPKLTIHTDFCAIHHGPERVFLCKNNNIDNIKAKLGLDFLLFEDDLSFESQYQFGKNAEEEKIILHHLQEAQKEGLISADDIDCAERGHPRKLSIRAIFNNEYGVIGLREHLFTIQQIDPIDMDVLNILFSKDGLKYLREIKPDLKNLSENFLKIADNTDEDEAKEWLQRLILLPSKEMTLQTLLTTAHHTKYAEDLDPLIEYLLAKKRIGNPEFELLRNKPQVRNKICMRLNTLYSTSELQNLLIKKSDSLLIAWLNKPLHSLTLGQNGYFCYTKKTYYWRAKTPAVSSAFQP